MKKKCIFCEIVKGEIESVKIWEDSDFIAILDKFPNTEGMTLVISKQHFNSDIFGLDDEDYKKVMLATKKVSNLLEKGLGVKRVAMICEGMEIDHLHIKLYPLHGLKSKFEEMLAEEKIYFNKYKGYVTSLTGKEKSIEELKMVVEKIRKNLRGK